MIVKPTQTSPANYLWLVHQTHSDADRFFLCLLHKDCKARWSNLFTYSRAAGFCCEQRYKSEAAIRKGNQQVVQVGSRKTSHVVPQEKSHTPRNFGTQRVFSNCKVRGPYNMRTRMSPFCSQTKPMDWQWSRTRLGATELPPSDPPGIHAHLHEAYCFQPIASQPSNNAIICFVKFDIFSLSISLRLRMKRSVMDEKASDNTIISTGPAL